MSWASWPPGVRRWVTVVVLLWACAMGALFSGHGLVTLAACLAIAWALWRLYATLRWWQGK